MPKFYFDIHDGRRAMYDANGIEIKNIEEAADEAAALLPALMRDAVPDRHSQSFAAAVRDENGDVVYRSILLFRGWMTAEPMRQMSPMDASAALKKRARELADRLGDNIHGLMAEIERARAAVEATQKASPSSRGI